MQRPSREESHVEPRSPDSQRTPEQVQTLQERQPAKEGLIPTHELIRIANALGIDVDHTTLRFWRKRGLIPKAVRGPVTGGRGTCGYYDASLLDRLAFIRKTQEIGVDLKAIREELDRLDRCNAQAGSDSPANTYDERLDELQAQNEAEEKRNQLTALSRVLGLDPEEIATIAIRKKDGEIVQILT